MDAHMVLQVDGLGERYTAHVTLVVLFARVQLLVRPEAGVAREPPSARVAGEWFFRPKRGKRAKKPGNPKRRRRPSTC